MEDGAIKVIGVYIVGAINASSTDVGFAGKIALW